jgi:hypothetical protein
MICLICQKNTPLNRGICQPCRDRILRPHYLQPIKKPIKKNGK